MSKNYDLRVSCLHDAWEIFRKIICRFFVFYIYTCYVNDKKIDCCAEEARKFKGWGGEGIAERLQRTCRL